MSTRKKQRRQPRRIKPLIDPDAPQSSATAYLITFMVKTPPGMTPEYVPRESPPTLDEDQARAAWRQMLGRLEDLGIVSPRLIARTVTDVVLEDLDAPPAPADDGSDIPEKPIPVDVTPDTPEQAEEKRVAREALAAMRNRSKLPQGADT